ncbi:MAG: hypothetical protein GY855_01130, partial [candidate division Zixibacteria bacterium]|nr:hypothetical protein [candidate division Zixibacteria bacterium]
MKSIIICFVATILIISNVCAADSANERIVLKSLDGITSQQIENLISEYVSLSDINIRSFYPYKIKNPIIREALKNLYVIKINEKSDLDNILGQLNNLAEIDYAESYSYPRPLYTPNDPFYYTQWHIPQIAGDLAWDIVRGVQTEIAVIAIVDTGIDYEHPDIGENMWINSSEDINGNGVFDNYPENSGGDLNYFDDDENGFEDDVIGFDLAENDPNPR